MKRCVTCDREVADEEIGDESEGPVCKQCMKHMEEDPADFCSICGHTPTAAMASPHTKMGIVFLTLCHKHAVEYEKAKDKQKWLIEKQKEQSQRGKV